MLSEKHPPFWSLFVLVQVRCQANRRSFNVTVFFQPAFGFRNQPTPDLVLGGPTITGETNALVAVDLDGDGEIDLISGNRGADNLTVFWGGD